MTSPMAAAANKADRPPRPPSPSIRPDPTSVSGDEDAALPQRHDGDNKDLAITDDDIPPTLLGTSPPGYGLLITLAPDPERSTHSLTLRFVPDSSHPHVHPHARCPATVSPTSTRLLHGGGSGAAVFSGQDEELGSIVMKHGGYKDLDEVVALATVHRDLAMRGRDLLEDGGGGGAQDEEGKQQRKSAERAGSDIASRIPDFRSVYVSPAHLHDRGRDLWDILRRALRRWGGRGLRARASDLMDVEEEKEEEKEESEDEEDENEEDGDSPFGSVGSEDTNKSDNGDGDGDENGGGGGYGQSGNSRGGAAVRNLSGLSVIKRTRSSMCEKKYGNPDRTIRIFVPPKRPRADGEHGDGTSSSVRLSKHYLDVYLDPDADIARETTDDGAAIVRLSGPPNASGYAALLRLSSDLGSVLRRKLWKATLAQRTIGAPTSPTASSLHLSGKLRENDGELLEVLIDEFVRVVKELRSLTRPEEEDALEEVRADVAALDKRLAEGEGNVSAADVSPLVDQFVGRAVRKNFRPTDSRFGRLRDFGDRMRSSDESGGGKIILTAEEVVPAHVLGWMLTRDDPVKIGDLFVLPADLCSRRTGKHAASTSFADGVYDGSYDGLMWLRLLRHATSLQGRACTSRIWNAGLADAGLHNQFLDGGRLLLFDLGKPSLEPVPAFLTKFFMSFFHTPGMEEEDGGGWVRRFRVVEGDEAAVRGGVNRTSIPKLALTEDTDALLPEIHKSFERTMDRFVAELFDGEDEVRGLIVKYVIFQLVSDAAFCLEKWEIKGGGMDRSGNHNTGLEKWLWRALWDMFAAWHVGTTLLAAEDFVL